MGLLEPGESDESVYLQTLAWEKDVVSGEEAKGPCEDIDLILTNMR